MRAQSYEPTDVGGAGPGAAYWRFRAWTVPVTLLVGVLLGGIALLAPNDATADTNVYLRDPRGASVLRTGSSSTTDVERYAKQRAQFMLSERVLGDVVTALGDVTIDELKDQVTSRTTVSYDLVVSCTAPEAERAVEICDAVVTAYRADSLADVQQQEQIAQTVLEEERDALASDTQLDPAASALPEIDQRLVDLRVGAALFGDGVEFTTGPEIVETSRLRPVIQYGLAGILFGALAAAGIAWALANRRPVATSSRTASAVLGVPVLGEVDSRQLERGKLEPGQAAEFQLLATGLSTLQASGVLATSSAHRHEGMARMVAELALATARDGRSVLVIDGDGTDRRLGTVLGVPSQRPGLTEVLDGSVSVQRAVVSRPVGTGQVDVLGAGSLVDDAPTLLRSQAARDLISGARQRYNLVVVNAAPLLDHAEGTSLASQSDGVILVVPAGEEVADLEIVRDRLDVVRTPLLGVVFDRSGG